MASNQFDQRILELVNNERANVGLDSLSIDDQLDQAANLHTDEMVQADQMSHQLPGEASLGDRVSATGYNWTRLGENVAAGYTTPESVVEGWMNSPGHRENILNPEFTSIGIGYDNAPDDNNSFNDFDVYWTQVFGTDGFSG
ncbi:MAG: CAP domain-containing protein [Pleurocapsa sp. MO_192.B19]|nr:CAP domain-containing protein [Pleurocapsa sp. MO_192.B19]